MAKVTAPLFSQEAHGTLGNALTYSKRKTHRHVRHQKEQMDFVTEAREVQRDKFYVSSQLWRALPQSDKDMWADIADQGWTVY